jgi:dipeptidyl-peptidase 4
MRLNSLLFIIVLNVTYHSQAQNSVNIDSLFAGAYKIRKLDSIKWQPGNGVFTYFQDGMLRSQTVKSEKHKELGSVSSFLALAGSGASSLFSYEWESARVMRLLSADVFARIDVRSKRVLYRAAIDSGAAEVTVSPGGSLAYSLDSALVVIDSLGKKFVVEPKEPGAAYGLAPYRKEFAAYSGTIWSPDGQKLMFHKKDLSNVELVPLTDTAGQVQKWLRYPKAGSEFEKVSIGIYDMETGMASYLEIKAQPGSYLINPVWDRTSNSVYVTVLNRAQNQMQLREYDAASGQYVRTLLNDSNPRYLNMRHRPIFLSSKPEFLRLHAKNGRNHIYHYDIEGLLLSPVTSGDWDVTEVLGLDSKEENIFFIGTSAQDYKGRYLYSANIISLRVTQLTKQEGTHQAAICLNTGVAVAQRSSYTLPAQYYIVNDRGIYLRDVYSAPSPFAHVRIPSVEHGSFRAGNTDLSYHLYKPADFTAASVYPLVIYIYGGPRVQTVRNDWLGGFGILPHLYAQSGHVVMAVDTRGSLGRGIGFEQATHLRLGQEEIEDIAAAIKHAGDFPFIDDSRVGIAGWSYGGYLALAMAAYKPELIKACIAGAPVTCWTQYEAMYTERYMSVPENNPEGYSWANLAAKAAEIQAKVLLISPDMDQITLPHQHRQFAQAAYDAGRDLQLLRLPGQGHSPAGDAYKELVEQMLEFFRDKL